MFVIDEKVFDMIVWIDYGNFHIPILLCAHQRMDRMLRWNYERSIVKTWKQLLLILTPTKKCFSKDGIIFCPIDDLK